MAEKPNFLIVMSDQHSPDTMGGAGHPAAKTPSLDRLLASGIRFRNAYCSYPMCTPSRASFMTGHLTTGHGVWELGTPLGTDMPTWAHVLRQAGYLTSISGRMHFVGHDRMHGFQRRAHPELGNHVVPFTYGDWDVPQQDDHVMLAAIKNAGPADEATRAEQYDAGVVAAAVDELGHLVSQKGPRPWALTVGLFLPHFPYSVSRRYFDLYEDADIPMPRVPPNERTCEELIPAQLHGQRKWLGLTTDGASEGEVRMARRCYYGMITCMDELIGRLVAELETLGVADDTWIVYLSDHGDNMGEHGLWSKMNFYEDSVRIPLIVVPPGGRDAAACCDAPVSIVDWMPTILELTGRQTHFESLPGRSLLPLIADPTRSGEDRPIVADYACDGTRTPMRMVRRGRLKASFAPGLPPTLFDLAEDPYEWRDLAGDASFGAVLNDLYAIACRDGWDPETLGQDILLHKRRLKYIRESETAMPSAGPQDGHSDCRKR